MEDIRTNLESVRGKIEKAAQRVGRSPDEIILVGVSKVQPLEKLEAAVAAGLIHVGENRVQEAATKVPHITGNVVWHLIGHLQRNKARKAAQLFNMIESVDSERLVKELSKQCESLDTTLDVLLEVNLGDERAKSGVKPNDLMDLVKCSVRLPGVIVKGIMVIPPFLPDPEASRPYFKEAKRLLEELKGAGIEELDIRHLSMGMSNDYEIAVEEGATIVRVGTAIFGERHCQV
ncbi:YggS family pyridoxal phosphate-dependent enzyme [bacterium]|nr:YggS family pyridoxal phosphate-dependent enzyme [bacterium]